MAGIIGITEVEKEILIILEETCKLSDEYNHINLLSKNRIEDHPYSILIDIQRIFNLEV